MVKYNADFDDCLINRKTLKDWTGKDFNSWKKITGCFHSDFPSNFVDKIDVKGKYPRFSIQGSNRHVEFNIFINIKKAVVFFEFFRLTKRNQGDGLKAFVEVVEAAASLGFDSVECQAACKRDKSDPHVGYMVLAKFGFTMKDVSQAAFLEEMRKAGRNEGTIQELISTKEGEEFWLANGKKWAAIFSLLQDPRSENLKLFDAYKNRKLGGARH